MNRIIKICMATGPQARLEFFAGRGRLAVIALGAFIGAFSLSAWSAPQGAGPADQGQANDFAVFGAEFAMGHVLVKLRPGAVMEARDLAALGGVSLAPTSLVTHRNAMLASQIGLDRWRTVTLAAGRDPEQAVAELSRHPAVEVASVDGVGGVASVVPNDPSFSSQWALLNTGQVADGVAGISGSDVGATAAWTLTTGGRPTVVAVLDSGVSLHPDLAGRVLQGFNIPDQNTNTSDLCVSHGTHVSGIIGASGNNGTAIAGLCWDVMILPVVVVKPCGGVESWVADGITWAVDNGADLINMSLQYSTGSAYLHDAVKYAFASGVPMIAATGNSSAPQLSFPARWPETIAVGATNNADQRWWGSNWGPNIDLMGPGVGVLSLASDGGTMVKTGTSMAAPHVTGTIALMLSVNPSLSESSIRSVLHQTAKDIGDPGYDLLNGWGRVDAFAAVSLAIDLLPIPGDLDGNGVVDGADLALLLGSWGECAACNACPADLDGDCSVGGSDLAILLGHWSAS
ncbi:MAG: S8 family serine peptidase [Phycisphaeraceae bacterium]|nr:S8 family serine peptidase [Phycisphaeraceae bacterium]